MLSSIFAMAVLADLSHFALAEYRDFSGCLLPSDFFTVKEKIEHFNVRNTDIWVASYPKSGTTWLQELVWLLCNNLNYEKSDMDVNKTFSFIEVSSLHRSLEMFQKKHNIINKINVYNKPPDIFRELNYNKDSIRFVKTHLPWDLLPRQIKDGAKKPKILYLLRHPKQIAPLYYHHMADTFQVYKGTKTTFFKLYTEGKLLYGNYFTNVLSYWNKRFLPNIMIVTHENMCNDLKSVVENVTKFLDKSFTTEVIDELVERLNYNESKRKFSEGKCAVIHEEGKEIIVTDCSDDNETEFPEKLSEKIDIWVTENVCGTGLPYEKIQEENLTI